MQVASTVGRWLARAVLPGSYAVPTGVASSEHVSSIKQKFELRSTTSGFSKFEKSQTQLLSKWTNGDDSCFLSKHTSADVIGVADGVGGWRNYGIDPGQLSSLLMKTCDRMVREGRFLPQLPDRIIAEAYEEVLNGKNSVIGSTTACVISLARDERCLYTANLGDSGFLLVRDGRVLHRSSEQQHYFNTPYQLTVAPPSQENVVLSDRPEMADVQSFHVEEGDIIVLATDGLFDNMHEEMILREVNKLKKRSEPRLIEATAKSLASTARQLSLDPTYMSPFANSARKNGFDMTGGKPDDITVILAEVCCFA